MTLWTMIIFLEWHQIYQHINLKLLQFCFCLKLQMGLPSPRSPKRSGYTLGRCSPLSSLTKLSLPAPHYRKAAPHSVRQHQQAPTCGPCWRPPREMKPPFPSLTLTAQELQMAHQCSVRPESLVKPRAVALCSEMLQRIRYPHKYPLSFFVLRWFTHES